jgi:GTPase
MVVADIPGLVEGAAEGAGLGHRFLRHVERTRVLLHILDASPLAGPDRDPVQDFLILNRELSQYAPELADRPQVVALGKMDLTEVRERAESLRSEFRDRGIQILEFSSATGDGVRAVLEELWRVSRAELDRHGGGDTGAEPG